MTQTKKKYWVLSIKVSALVLALALVFGTFACDFGFAVTPVTVTSVWRPQTPATAPTFDLPAAPCGGGMIQGACGTNMICGVQVLSTAQSATDPALRAMVPVIPAGSMYFRAYDANRDLLHEFIVEPVDSVYFDNAAFALCGSEVKIVFDFHDTAGRDPNLFGPPPWVP